MSPLTQKQAKNARQTRDAIFFMEYFVNRILAVLCGVGILYLSGHILLWYLNGMPTPIR